MSSPASAQSPSKGGAGAGVAPATRTLDCSICKEPFSPVIGPRYPRMLSPCAHTFCTECIEKQLQARGPNGFRCLTHDQPVAISKAEDAKANFALIELLELIAKDADHQVVDERTKPPSCSECNAPSVWYCKNDDACFCDAHKISEHAAKSRFNHVLMPVAERTANVVPKCDDHPRRDAELWCTLCPGLCCTMCERSGKHKDHAAKLVPVDDVVKAQRLAVQSMAKEASKLTSGKLHKEAQSLIKLKADYTASARHAQEELSQQQAEMMRAVEARFMILNQELQAQETKGLQHIDLRVDDLTMNRSRAAMVSEEAARVLRMSDYALLAHVPSVEQNMVRARKGWEEYQLRSKLPGKMEFRCTPKLALKTLQSLGSIFQPWIEVDLGKPVPIADPVLRADMALAELMEEEEEKEEEHRRNASKAAGAGAGAKVKAAKKQ